MFRKTPPVSLSPFLACVLLTALLLLPGALAQAADFFRYAVIELPVSQLRPEKPWHRVISTQAEWESFYRELAGPSAQVPAIDFAQYRVVAGGLGLQHISTYLTVDTIGNDGSKVYVGVFVATAAPGCVTLAAMGYPTIAIVIPQSTLPVVVSATRATYECAGASSTPATR